MMKHPHQQNINEATMPNKKFETASAAELTALIQNTKQNTKINYNGLLAAASNPKLSEDMILNIFSVLSTATKDDSVSPIAKATKTKNVNIRRKIRNQLYIHKNLPQKYIEAAIKSGDTVSILKNPHLTESNLQRCYDLQVMPKKNGIYDVYTLGKLLKSPAINTDLQLKWYKDLLPFADWKYNDERWDSAMYYFTESKNCPIEVLKDIAIAPPDGREIWRNGAENLRKRAVEHQKAPIEIKSLAFQATGDLKYLSDLAQEIFIF